MSQSPANRFVNFKSKSKNPVGGGEDLTILPAALARTLDWLGYTNHHATGWVAGGLAHRKEVTDDVLGQGRLSSLIVSGQTDAVVYRKTGGMPPGQEFCDQSRLL